MNEPWFTHSLSLGSLPSKDWWNVVGRMGRLLWFKSWKLYILRKTWNLWDSTFDLKKRFKVISLIFSTYKGISSERAIGSILGEIHMTIMLSPSCFLYLIPKGNLEDYNGQELLMKDSLKSIKFGNVLNLLSWNSHFTMTQQTLRTTLRKYLIKFIC